MLLPQVIAKILKNHGKCRRLALDKFLKVRYNASNHLLAFAVKGETMPSRSDESASQAGSESRADATRQRILQAAAQLFAEKGYAGTTTRAIAAAAAVNEVTLFRHFGNKRNLLAAVLDQFSALPDLVVVLEEQLTGDYRQDLLRLGSAFLAVMTERRETVRLMLCEAEHLPEVRQVMAQIPRQLRQLLTRHLQGQIQQGRVRNLNPQVMAQAFFGMFFSYSLTQVILDDPAAPEVPLEELVAQFVDLFVDGTITRNA